jgi:plasmid stability protein
MAQLLVRDIEDDVKSRLQERAQSHGMSLEALVRDILRDAAKAKRPTNRLGTEIADLFRGRGLDEDIPEWHGETVEPPKFD